MPPPPPGDGGSFNQRAADKVISHRLALLRYEAGTTRAMLTAYEGALGDVREALDDLDAKIKAGTSRDGLQLDRLRGLSKDLDQRVRELRRTLEATLSERLTEAGDAEALFLTRTFDQGLGASMVTVPEGAVALAIREPIGGGIWTDRLATDLFEVREGLQGSLARMLAQGASTDRIAAAIGRSGFIPYLRDKRRFAASFSDSFIALNLSQFPETLIESELFGHRKGSFTGAIDHHAGVFERCNAHGALFLDV